MEFCPECGSILVSNGDELECTCGYKQSLNDANTNFSVSEKVDAKDTVVVTDNEVRTLPTTKITCPECGNDQAEWWLQQTRSADEAETRFFKCLKCKHTWREYD